MNFTLNKTFLKETFYFKLIKVQFFLNYMLSFELHELKIQTLILKSLI